MITKTYKVYGINGHRQKESFNKSYIYNFSTKIGGVRIIEVFNGDKTGTNKYSIFKITRETTEQCKRELDGQISDGIFENVLVGEVEEI